MRKKGKHAIFLFVLILLLMFFNQDFSYDFFKSFTILILAIFQFMNLFSVGLIGDSVLTLIFKTAITFVVVGIVLEVFSIPKGTFGKWFGKGAFWLIGLPVSFILNILSKLIFK